MNIRSNPDTTRPAVTTGRSPRRENLRDAGLRTRRPLPLREIMLSEGAGETEPAGL